MTKTIVSPPSTDAKAVIETAATAPKFLSREEMQNCREALFDAFNTLESLSSASKLFPSECFSVLADKGEIDPAIAMESFLGVAEKRLNIILHILNDKFGQALEDAQ
jgi:hypothetical protein